MAEDAKGSKRKGLKRGLAIAAVVLFFWAAAAVQNSRRLTTTATDATVSTTTTVTSRDGRPSTELADPADETDVEADDGDGDGGGGESDSTDDRSPADCSVVVEEGDSLNQIAGDARVELAGLLDENALDVESVIHPGDRLDVCIGNDVDDVTGASRLAPPPAAVRRQQEHLNELFSPYRFAELVVDGDSGPLTRQLLCAARMGLGLTVTGAHMPESSADEAALFAATSLSIPEGAATSSDQWILIDNTCQVLFIGEGEELVNVYPTSTGSPGFETRRAQAVEAFRFDPALANDGWHDSSRFPTEVDDPRNGNMYKPIYFSNGQAIHGANYVPPDPQSKGCARTFPHHQDELIAWLGLEDITEATWQRELIGVTVTVQGDFRPAR